MKSLSLATKALKRTIRDRRTLFFLLLFPIVLMIIFAFAFGSSNSLGTGTAPHEIAVINLDQGAAVSINNTTEHINAGATFTQLLENVTYPQTDTHMFTLNNVSADQALSMLKGRALDAVITIPENFSQAVVSLTNASTRAETTSDIGLRVINGSAAQLPVSTTLPKQGNVTSQIIVEGDTDSNAFAAAQSLIFNLLQQYQGQIQAMTIRQVDATLAQKGSNSSINYISAAVQPLTGTRSLTLFDYQAPGVIVFALLLQVGSVAQDLARESARGTLGRLKLSNMRSFDLLFGTLLSWIVFAVAQILLLLGVAVALGFEWFGGANSIVLAVLIGLIGGIASISLGLLLAAFTTNERQAAQLGVLIAVPVFFLTGSFFPLPNEIHGTAFGTTFQVYDLLPWTQVADALRQILVFGSGFGDVAAYVGFAIVLTAILFVIGVIFYSLVRLRSELRPE